MLTAGGGPGTAWSPSGLDGAGAGVGIGFGFGIAGGTTGSVDYDLRNDAMGGATAHVGPTIAIAEFGRAFVSCTGCADLKNGKGIERFLPAQVA